MEESAPHENKTASARNQVEPVKLIWSELLAQVV